MAGITKEQRAERAAASAASAPTSDEHLIAIEKDGETLEVHPTCVEDHQRLGWKLANA